MRASLIVWRPVTNAILSALLSPPCAACASVLDRPLEGAVCEPCWSTIAPAALPSCRHCRSIACGIALGEYDGRLREIIHALKYHGRRSIAPRLARMMRDHGQDVLGNAEMVVPVPLHQARLRERGFNQAHDLAAGLGLPIVGALRRTANTPSQVDLPATERHTNVRDAFAIARPALSGWRRHDHNEVTGKVVVLVDDVTTTGATLDACARVLRNNGAREVRALTAARVANVPR